MSKSVILGTIPTGNLTVDVDALLRTRAIVQANSGGGKSWLLRRLAEQLFGKVPVIIVDPEGEFASLRERFGFVLAGQGGETPADPRSAEMLAHRLLELHASCVCDLYELRPHERHRWVRTFIEALLDAPKALWQPLVVIVDEAHVYCPEKGAGESEASGAVTDLASRGRKRGYCPVLATQRLGKLRKDTAAELTNALVGRTWLDVDRDRACDILGVSRADKEAFHQQIRSLRPGQFFALGPALATTRTLLAVGAVQTTHAEAGSGRHAAAAPPAPAEVARLLPKLSDLPKEAEHKAKTEAELRAEIRGLKAALANATAAAPSVAQIAKAVAAAEAKAAAGHAHMVQGLRAEVAGLRAAIAAAVRALGTPVAAAKSEPTEPPKIAPPSEFRVAAQNRTALPPSVERRAPAPSNVGKGELVVLRAIAMYPDGVDRDQLTVLTGYKRSSRDTYIQRLASAGMVEAQPGGRVAATADGIAALGAGFEPLPTGKALQEFWLTRLSGGEREILQYAIHRGGARFRREEIDDALPYKRSSRDTYLQRLASRRLVEPCGGGEIRAAAALFMEMQG